MTPEEQAEIAMCNECISHLLENAGPDHIIVKYRAALIKLQEQAEEIKRLADALVEERAGQVTAVRLVRQLDAVWITEEKTDEDRQIAREQLRAEKVIR